MNEFKTSDVQETKTTEVDNFKNIKPESDITVKESKEFWDNEFSKNDNSLEQENPRQETVDGKTYYYDDNGQLYREDKDLIPNSEYKINGYEYKTDEVGRIISAEGKLHMKEREERLTIKDSLQDIGKGDELAGSDNRGHLIADRFDGSNGLENMVPQDAKINQTDFAKFENQLASEVKNGSDVRVKIEPIYGGDSRRPDAIGVSYSINGEQSMQIFPNGKE